MEKSNAKFHSQCRFYSDDSATSGSCRNPPPSPPQQTVAATAASNTKPKEENNDQHSRSRDNSYRSKKKDKKKLQRGQHQQQQQRKRGNDNRYGACHTCGRSGHQRQECHYSGLSCHNCGRVGHLASVCRQPKKNANTAPPQHGQYPLSQTDVIRIVAALQYSQNTNPGTSNAGAPSAGQLPQYLRPRNPTRQPGTPR